MSQQQIWVNLEMLQRLVGEVNNDLATLVVEFAGEQDKALQEAKHNTLEWKEKAEVLHSMLRSNAQWVQYTLHASNDYYPDDLSLREGYQQALRDTLSNQEMAGPL